MKSKFKSCPKCGQPMCEIDNVSYCLKCGCNTAPKETTPTKYRRFVVDNNKEIVEIARRNLQNDLDGSLQYCLRRGFTDECLKRWELGYIPKNFSRFRTKREQELWERRVLFPIRSNDGKHVVGFGGRKIESDDRAKYVNSPTSQEYEKRTSMYGAWLLPEKTEIIYLCEGYVDVISMDTHGYAFPLASLGTSLTVEQAAFIYDHANNVVIAYDADEAGQIATTRAIDLLHKAGFKWPNIRCLHIEGAKDVDEALTKGGSIREISVEEYFVNNCMWNELTTLQIEGGVSSC